MGILKNPRYINFEDMKRRIGQTVIKYKGKHVYAQPNENAPRELSLDLMNIHTREEFKGISSSDEDLDVNAFPIGYVNKGEIAVFTARMPARINRQGLCSDNTVYFYRGREAVSNIGRSDIHSSFFFDMLNDNYPSFEVALKKVSSNDEINSIAINKKLALERTDIGLVNLIYFTTPVAVFDSKSKSFKVTERFAHYLPILKHNGIDAEAI